MNIQHITPAKRKRLLKTFGPFPAGYTHDDLERFLDLLYGMFSDVYTMAELRQITVSDPFDRSEHPRQLKLVELTDWLEAVVACDPPTRSCTILGKTDQSPNRKTWQRVDKHEEHRAKSKGVATPLFLAIAAGHR